MSCRCPIAEHVQFISYVLSVQVMPTTTKNVCPAGALCYQNFRKCEIFSSVSGTGSDHDNPQDRLKWSLAAVWHHTCTSLIPC